MGLITQFQRGNCEVYFGNIYKNAHYSWQEYNLEIQSVVHASGVYLEL